MASSFLVRRLTGEYVLDHHSASQCDPLYDLAAEGWIEEWAALVAPGLALPRLLWPGEQAGTVTAAAAAETGLREGTPVATGTIDAWAEALSVGAVNEGDTMLMYGSTMFIVEVVPQTVGDPRLWLTAGVLPHTRTLAAGMATSGSLTGWLQGIAGGVPFETLLAEAAASPPGAHALVTLPYFAGERTPLFDPRARGVVIGLTLSHQRGDLYAHCLRPRPSASATTSRRCAKRAGACSGSSPWAAAPWRPVATDRVGRDRPASRRFPPRRSAPPSGTPCWRRWPPASSDQTPAGACSIT